MVGVAVILIAVSIPFFNIPEMRMWFPMTLIIAGLLGWSGITRYREARSDCIP